MPRFRQLDRLAEYGEWPDRENRWYNANRKRKPRERRPLDEIYTDDGVQTEPEDDE